MTTKIAALEAALPRLGALPAELMDQLLSQPQGVLAELAKLVPANELNEASPDADAAVAEVLEGASSQLGISTADLVERSGVRADTRAFDPLSLTATLVGAVILLQTSMKVHRRPDGTWEFVWDTKRSNTKLIAKVLATIRGLIG